MTATSASSVPEPLLDLQGLIAGIRWRRRTWISLGLLGLLAGALLAIFAPPPATAVVRLLIVHETESPDSGQMATDVALLETTRIAAAALERLDAPGNPEDFLKSYEAEGLTSNVLELTVRGPHDQAAVLHARALAETFIADHIQRAEAAANAEAQALLDRSAQLETELAEVDDPGARTELTARIQELRQRAQEAAIGAPDVVAGTRTVDGPRAVTESPVVALVKNAVVGFVLGIGAGLALAAVTSVVADRPVLRRDIAAALGASVIAQLPAPRRRLAWLGRSRAAKDRKRVAATLARATRDAPAAVSLLELGCPRVAAALAVDIATDLAVHHPVVVVDDLPAGHLHTLTAQGEKAFQLVDAAGTDPPSSPPEQQRYLGAGSVGPGTAWTDLNRLGSEAVLVVRAGHASAAWLHTVARQLADARISVIGVVLVHPDPRDRSDGTLWDGLHTALRRRAGATTEPAARGHDAAVAPYSAAPYSAATPNGTATAAPRVVGSPLVVPERRFGPGDVSGTSRAQHPPTTGSPEVETSNSATVEAR